MTNGSTPAGWYQDPTGQGESRYWNGVSWTQSVNRGGATVNVPIDAAQAEQPPAPGTMMAAPAPPAQPATVVEQSSSHSALGTIIGVVVALFAVVVLLAVIGNATADDSPTPGTEPAPAEEAPPAEGTAGGG